MTWPGPWFRPEHPLTGTVRKPIESEFPNDHFQGTRGELKVCRDCKGRCTVQKSYISMQHLFIQGKSHHRLGLVWWNYILQSRRNLQDICQLLWISPKLWCTNNNHCSYCEEGIISEEITFCTCMNFALWRNLKKDDTNWNSKSNSQHF